MTLTPESQVIYIGNPKRNPFIISPNLEALLEHDQRTRPRLIPEPPSTTFGAFIGLPPPPRGPRKTSPAKPDATATTATADADDHLARRSDPSSINPFTKQNTLGPGGVTPSSSSHALPVVPASGHNPFINPAPSLESVLEAKAMLAPPPLMIEPEVEKDQFMPLPRDHRTYTPELNDPPSATAIGHPSLVSPSSSTSYSPREGVRRRTRRRVPAKIPYQSDNQASDNQASTKTYVKRVPLADPSNRRLASNVQSTGSGNGPSEKRSADVRPRGRNDKTGRLIVDSTVDKAIRPRSLLSHDYETWSTSSGSDSDSTCGPPSTVPDEIRISISSTVYQPQSSSHFADDHSLTHSDQESFIEFSSPTCSTFSFTSDSDRHPSSPLLMDIDRPLSRSDTTKSNRPPLPTTPKPHFDRSAHTKSSSRRASPESHVLPPTTNLLNPEERAELIKRNRKIAQVFGTTPGADALPKRNNSDTVPDRHSRHRSAHSIDLDPLAPEPYNVSRKSSATAASLYDAHERPRSTPPNPNAVATCVQSLNAADQTENLEKLSRSGPSVTSFIDLSYDDGRSKRRDTSASSTSLFENMTEEERLEEDRRRKREKLTKLHRFLGSRVPTNLALGLVDIETAFQTPVSPEGLTNSVAQADSQLPFLRRRRSSSVIALPTTWSDDIDRLKEELDHREKAVNVRRAVKMEKVFGVQPPQTLYHTRRTPSPSVRASTTTGGWQKVDTANSDNSSYLSPNYSISPPSSAIPTSPPFILQRNADVYTHYQHSLNSLHDIIDRDDRVSLAELHEYLTNETPDYSAEPLPQYVGPYGSPSKAERRRSLPARTSVISLVSTLTITSPEPEVSDFQLRRRRAAKLTHFFGVDYRVLVKEVLESIEKGVDDEQKKGTLNPAQAEDLMQKLRNLKMKRAPAS